MAHTTNPTAVHPIDKKDIALSIDKDHNTFSFSRVNVHSLKLPSSAYVKLIVWNKYARRRFSAGTVAKLNPIINQSLEVFEGASVSFRIIIAELKTHKLLASCERIKPDFDDLDDDELMIVNFVPDLGQIFHKLELSEDPTEFPKILINSAPELGLRESWLKKDPYIRGLIFPASLRQTLVYLAQKPRDETPDGWQERWKLFLENLGESIIEEGEEYDEILRWADETLEKIYNRLNYTFASDYIKQNNSGSS